ncbi:transcriptional regulator with XRE-family HTH domain [Kitasatospora sp. MAA19]|uniref:helix-turn-helix domain-containing protein n=1 Tax=Kitasatospora sp. MAA19 TaxID=3035090 RepID=UPI0024760381|nr:pyridoxamine 5'-phosphate oxidase family protein [Kitasatospora sp. MAA19]MDH6708248.1 transcriptional regulator with XRE-family HTH domain [Kitasatospora sp. MAA19]
MNDTPDDIHRADPAAVARRIADRREQLGVSEEALAQMAAMAPRYLSYLLEAGPAFDPGGFLRIAAALGLSRGELLEGRTEGPPGQGGPGPHPRLLGLTEAECWDLVGTHGIGRIALPVHPGPIVFPVNYVVDDGTFAYRTGDRTAPSEGTELSFQVDHIDEYLGRGWSVLAIGTAEPVHDPAVRHHLAGLPGAIPWPGGDRPRWVRLRPDEITGRRLVSD